MFSLSGCIFYNYELSIFIVVIVVRRRPDCSTHVAKLISTFARHVVAALILFNHELALRTLPIMQITLEKLHLVLIAFSLVLGQKAFPTKL